MLNRNESDALYDLREHAREQTALLREILLLLRAQQPPPADDLDKQLRSDRGAPYG
jgi:hypothetical protein